MIIWRSTAIKATIGMMIVSLFYLVLATVFHPASLAGPTWPVDKNPARPRTGCCGQNYTGNTLMELVLVLRWLHVMGATVLIGTGVGIAFFMMISNRSKNAQLIAHTASTVVLADTVFTLSAVIVQPVTGILLAWETGWALSEGWIVLSLLVVYSDRAVLATCGLDTDTNAQLGALCRKIKHLNPCALS